MTGKTNLFVYGTLRRGFNHPMGQFLEEKANFLSTGYIFGLLFDLGPYPVAVCSDKHDQQIVGDIYVFTENSNLLSILDDYEGVGELLETGVTFERKQMLVRLPDGSQLDAWAYLHAGYIDHLIPIDTGDYLAYKSS
ncbi:gamma-glutamylcyclotransferase family protein [Cyclobacterium plantarum]|uniref:Gamma-glutamylcyclotransferase n=1 Tax=Cyclobacterium plantarum TaxID=2716263 RepID=A0ABX0HD35_9BACT|nr:gamma-glutamylcyclotransferase family protein [Cyclobacterium plantarum]NHE59804.1 gamma-glutamylcyclotransferase [Cyclobacterium plantarum]